MSNRQEHLDNWLYRKAREFTEEVRFEQIIKGADKYPVPLGDADWTPEQLVHHAMQENVDQAHYLTMLRHEIQKLRDENADLKAKLDAVPFNY